VTGKVSVNLYDVSLGRAIHAIAAAAGYAVEERNGDYYIVDKKDAGRESVQGLTQIRSFKVQYSDPKIVVDILTKHLSRYGKITALVERKIILVEDTPDFIKRIEVLLREVDVEPKQIMIEAKILEIELDGTESFGIDWARVFSADGLNRFGTAGFATGSVASPATGFFFNAVNRNMEAYLSALSTKKKVRTLSTPKLLALENQEAVVKIGDNLGYRVTTTINLVTSETIQFLETGIILRVTPYVNEQGQVLMKIHPEVSSGSLLDGIPSKRTTEVTSQLLVEDGQTMFIGGLIKRTVGNTRSGVPLLGDLPGIGLLFSKVDETVTMTETIVLITPRVIKNLADPALGTQKDKIDATDKALRDSGAALERRMDQGPQMPKLKVDGMGDIPSDPGTATERPLNQGPQVPGPAPRPE
jgi:type II secretory pathway component GspD/PulD (secretin)